MSALEITPSTSRKPRFPKDQTLISVPETQPGGFQIHPLDPDNSIILIGSAITDPNYLQGYIEKALAVPRTSPLCGTPAGPKEIPRAQLCYTVTGEPYTYSRTQHPTTAFPPHVTELIQVLLQKLDTAVPDQPYRVVDTAADLLYSDQQKNGGSISAHSDDENPNWGLVLVYSLGQTRYLRIRDKDKKTPFVNVELAHNTIAAMFGPTFQARYTHQIDKLKDGEPIYPRLSLNVRFLAES